MNTGTLPRTEARRKSAREWAARDRAANPDKYKRIGAEQRVKNATSIKAAQLKWKAKNPSYHKEHYRKNKSAIAFYFKNRRKSHPDLVREIETRSREKNKANRVEYQKRTKHLNRARNKKYQIKVRLQMGNAFIARKLRLSFYRAIMGLRKSASAITLLGCPVELFRLHLQNQFRDGMAWNNYGKLWHIDHIKPISSFDLSDFEEQKKCFHWSNMQPLLAVENLRKGAKIL